MESTNPHQTMSQVFMHESSAKQDNSKGKAVSDLEARIAELENELKKQKATAEKGAKLMQIIWGDKFQSDSLH